jgi:hypothetical protein
VGLEAVVATAPTSACDNDRPFDDGKGPRSLLVIMEPGATESDGQSVLARCGARPGADGGQVLMDDRQPGELRLQLENDSTSDEERRIRDCLATAPGVDVTRSQGFPEL